jgi:dynein light chain roadblock-type
MARSMVRELNPLNDLEFLRVRSIKHEIMVAPREYTALARARVHRV